MKMSFHLHADKTHFHMKGFARGLALKKRPKTIRKCPILDFPNLLLWEIHRWWYLIVYHKKKFPTWPAQAFFNFNLCLESPHQTQNQQSQGSSK